MPLPPESVRLGVSLDVETPECTRAELEPLLDQAFAKAKSELFGTIETQAGEGGMCTPHDKVTFDKSRCP